MVLLFYVLASQYRELVAPARHYQFLGIELNPWAVKVVELVLWIGYLQWHFCTHGKATPAEPVLRDFHNIENRNAVLDYTSEAPRMVDGVPVTRWDGITTKTHPVTAEEVPDEAAQVQVMDYSKPSAAKWPEAEFIVGNPPFIGASRMRDALGDGYAEALWAAYPKTPKSADFVMFWWHKAETLTRAWMPRSGKGTRRFGFITTNSLRQTFNRRVLEPHLSDPKKPLSLILAIPDHPWVDASMGAAVRIAMTVARKGRVAGKLQTIAEEVKGETENEGRVVRFDTVEGRIFGNLRIGADVAGAKALKANRGLSSRGVQVIGSGFIIAPKKARALGLGQTEGLEKHMREYRNGRDLTATPRGVMVIDLFGLTESEVRQRFPEVYQHVLDKVKPERDQNNRKSYREKWWIHGEPRKDLRPALEGLPHYIVTVETMQHRVFMFLEGRILPDNRLVVFGLNDPWQLSVFSSQIHIVWTLTTGGVLEDRPVYNKTKCFDPFPFPSPTDTQKTTLRALGEELDKHRKDRQAEHPKLTLTNMYNVLEKLRSGDVIEGKDKEIYEQGLIGLLKDIHDRIDAAVAAYDWPSDLTDEEILQKLVDLNLDRAREETTGKIRWLRPDYQNPDGRDGVAKGQTGEMDLGVKDTATKPPWPKTMPEQVAAVRDALTDLGNATPEQLARTFKRGRAANVTPLLESMVIMGSVTKSGGEVYRQTR